jgi:RNA:NAD 2'-phosphotransferase (TPT1/KptA family)
MFGRLTQKYENSAPSGHHTDVPPSGVQTRQQLAHFLSQALRHDPNVKLSAVDADHVDDRAPLSCLRPDGKMG